MKDSNKDTQTSSRNTLVSHKSTLLSGQLQSFSPESVWEEVYDDLNVEVCGKFVTCMLSCHINRTHNGQVVSCDIGFCWCWLIRSLTLGSRGSLSSRAFHIMARANPLLKSTVAWSLCYSRTRMRTKRWGGVAHPSQELTVAIASRGQKVRVIRKLCPNEYPKRTIRCQSLADYI